MRAPVRAASLLTAALICAQPARAQTELTPPISTNVVGDCLGGGALAASVRAHLAARPVAPGVAVSVRGRERPDVELDIEVVRHGEVVAVRRFTGPVGTCEGLLSAVSLVVAMAIEATPPGERPALLAPPAGAAPPARAPLPAPDFARSFAASAGVAMAVGPSSTAAPGGDVGVEAWLAPVLSVRAGVTSFPAWETDVGAGRATTRLLGGRLDACALSGRRLRAGACAGVRGGRLSARGASYAVIRRGTAPWAAGLLAGELRVALAASVELYAAAEVNAGFIRPRLDVRGPDGSVAASRAIPAVGTLVGAGVALRFR